jgi:hypothetical protein
MLGDLTLKEESPFSPSRVKYGFHSSLLIIYIYHLLNMPLPISLINLESKKCIKEVPLADYQH